MKLVHNPKLSLGSSPLEIRCSWDSPSHRRSGTLIPVYPSLSWARSGSARPPAPSLTSHGSFVSTDMPGHLTGCPRGQSTPLWRPGTHRRCLQRLGRPFEGRTHGPRCPGPLRTAHRTGLRCSARVERGEEVVEFSLSGVVVRPAR